MKIRNTCLVIIFCLLILMVLVGCQMDTPAESAAPSELPVAQTPPYCQPQGKSVTGEDIYRVSSVDELLAAIGNDRVLSLDAGVYDLSSAADYGSGSGEYWYWQEAFDGYELVISGVQGLRICGNVEKTEILTQPRYADVISFESCSGITLQNLTLGHSPEPGLCAGGVLFLDSCEDVKVENSYLFGCGIIGLQAYNCKNIAVYDSHIYDCSQNAVQVYACSDVRLENSRIHNNGSNYYGGLFQVENSRGFALVNCDIYENQAACLIASSYSQQVNLLGSGIRDNYFSESLFKAVGYSPVVDKCHFNSNGEAVAFAELPALDAGGNEHTRASLEAMQREEAEYSGPIEAEPPELNESINEEGLREVCVNSVDEFLAAIGSNTVIKLAGGTYDLSRATDYGAYGTDYYYWQDTFDGPSLVISGVNNLSIIADEGCIIAAIPRYADVLSFINCENLSLSGFTAGHTQEPGECAGAVLSFENCWDIDIDSCSLYGCGILGIHAYYCSDIEVKNTEIYECSSGAIALYTVMDARFENMDIHDCRTPEISLHDCMDILFEGEALSDPGGSYWIKDGKANASMK